MAAVSDELAKESLFQRTLIAWEKRVRESILEVVEKGGTQIAFYVSSSAGRTHEQNIATERSFVKIILDIAKEGSLNVHQQIKEPHEDPNYLLIQSISDVLFLDVDEIEFVVSWD